MNAQSQRDVDSTSDAQSEPPVAQPDQAPLPYVRIGISGILMGLANLVPGVSGGTMILIMGLYQDFIDAVANVSRLKFSRRNVVFLTILIGVVGVTIVSLSKTVATLMITHRLLMYSLFIGMTLGGAPYLWLMVRPINKASLIAGVLGIALMLGIALTQAPQDELSKEEKAALKEKAKSGELTAESAYGTDVAAGVLAMSSMVLPGISGAYMLLLVGRYEDVLISVSQLAQRNWSALHVVIPIGIGALIGLVGVTSLMKRMLQRHEKPTIGFLLGILLGSVPVIFGKIEFEGGADGAKAAGAIVVGLAITIALARLGNPRQPAEAG